MLAFAADFRWLILAFHKFGRALARKTPFDGAREISSESPRVNLKAGIDLTCNNGDNI
jgi:hypothetical protein